MKKIFLLLLLVFMSTQVLALETSDVVLYAGGSTQFQGYNVFVSFGNGGEKIRVNVDENPLFLETGLTADEFTDLLAHANSDVEYRSLAASYGDLIVNVTKLCFNVTKANCGRVNDYTKKAEPAVYITLKLKEPKVTVTKTYEKNSVWIGEDITVTAKVKNEGDVDVKNFVFEDVYPTAVVLKKSDFLVKADTIKYTAPFLAVGDEKVVTYSLHLKDTVTSSLNIKYSYEYRNVTYTDYSSAALLNLKEIVRTSFTFSPGTLTKRDTTDLTITIENVADDDVLFNASVLLPSGVEVKKSDIKGNTSGYSFTDTIDAGEKITKVIKLQPKSEGKYVASAKIDSKFIIQNPSILKTSEFTTVADSTALTATIIPRDQDVLEDENTQTEVFLTRGNNTVHDVNFTFEIPDMNLTQKIIYSELTGYYDSKTIKFKVPVVGSKKTYALKLYGNYTLRYLNGTTERKSISVQTSINAYPVKDAISVSQVLSPSSLAQGEKAVMTVKVQNNLDSRSFQRLFAEDDVPEDFIYKPIATSTYFSLQPKEVKQVYSYEIKAPYRVRDAELNTTITFEDISLLYSSSLSKAVRLVEPAVSISVSYPQTSDTQTGARLRFSFDIKNTGTIKIHNATLYFPVAKGLELIHENDSYFVDLLETGETVSVFRDYRTTLQGNLTIPPLAVIAHDSYGNAFVLKNTESTLQVLGEETPCAVIGTKILTSNTSTVVSKTTYRNVCAQSVNIKIDSSELSLPGNEAKTYTVEQKATTQIPETKFRYSFGQDYYITATNGIFNISVSNTTANASGTSSETGDGVGGSNTEGGSADAPMTLEDLGLPKQVAGAFIALFIVIFLMIVLIAVLKKIHRKNDEHPEEVVHVLEEKADPEAERIQKLMKKSSQFELQPPLPGRDLGELKTYIQVARNYNIPETTIQHNLLSIGWESTIVDAFMRKS